LAGDFFFLAGDFSFPGGDFAFAGGDFCFAGRGCVFARTFAGELQALWGRFEGGRTDPDSLPAAPSSAFFANANFRFFAAFLAALLTLPMGTKKRREERVLLVSTAKNKVELD
jgi:hypothetical protein